MVGEPDKSLLETQRFELQGRDARKYLMDAWKGGNKEEMKVGTLGRFIP